MLSKPSTTELALALSSYVSVFPGRLQALGGQDRSPLDLASLMEQTCYFVYIKHEDNQNDWRIS